MRTFTVARVYKHLRRYDGTEEIYLRIVNKNTRDDQLLKRLTAQGLAWLYRAQGRNDEGQRLWD
ncbi:hypothetical protein N7516_008281 [Penicillium verrucosum]|uniref:uncharacterized protein n=1 Tax=Penicillium verrucosum TaxID=60171 RepID=UPI002545466D|nr:uncharacterized protein N7516_008281 [Penicillium verrucosum]KAJ5926508.1 hypothetical protein N7516_008281 [Penicillium verrucosum]